MKRIQTRFERQKIGDELLAGVKKQKKMHFSELQEKIAFKTIPYLLEHGEKNLIKPAFEISFNTPKKVETLLEHTNYQMFWWAMEHEDSELMQYIIGKTTERGKFLIVCHNNYELIKKFICLQIHKINEANYKAPAAIETLKILINANPNTSYLITETVKNYLDNQSTIGNLAAINILISDFKAVSPDFADTENIDHKETDGLNFDTTSYNSNSEQELIGVDCYSTNDFV